MHLSYSFSSWKRCLLYSLLYLLQSMWYPLEYTRPRIFIALFVGFMTFAQWQKIKSFWNLLFLQQNFSLILHSVLFILSSELLKFIVSTLALYLLASLFGNYYGYLIDISSNFFFKTKPLSLHCLRKSVIEIWTVCCFDRKYILVLFSAWGGIRFQLK